MDIKKLLLEELNYSIDVPIEFTKDINGLKIIYDGKSINVFYADLRQYCRAFLIIKAKGLNEPFEFVEKCHFEKFGFMIDCSRNAVLNIETVKKLIRLLSMLGYNELMLYTEDTYEVDNEPYFGYLRGRYSKKELKELDEYADAFGVELVPCIQTLAHLNALPRWGEYSSTFDLGDILLVDNERTYSLIENMFKSLRDSYKTDKVHIGMDEAHLLGLGKYLDKHGFKERIEIFNKHLIKVRDIANKFGFKPMMWSDMFFRAVSKGQYKPFERDVMEKIKDYVPNGVDLVCWDYYQTDAEYCNDFIDCHKILNDKVIFANGLWCWQGFAPHTSFTLESLKISTNSCIEKGVQHLFSTAWGDDGAECPIFSLLPMLAAQSELAHKKSLDGLEHNFKALTGVDYEYFKNLENVNRVGDYPLKRQNPSKYMLFNDLLQGLLDCLVVEGDKERLKDFINSIKDGKGGEYEYVFQTTKLLAEAVYFKYDLGVELRKAYKANDKKKLAEFKTDVLPELIKKVENFYSAFRNRWHKDNKPFGFEVQDVRIGGLLQRIKNAIITLTEYLNGKIQKIEELEETILNFHCDVDYEKSITLNAWYMNVTNGRFL